MSNWSELTPHLLIEIVTRIQSLEDLIAFGGVCCSWRSVAVTEKSRFKSNVTPPWLMLPPKKDGNERDFFSMSKCTNLQVSLPQATAAKKCFSSKGWLLTIAQDWSMSLLHPFSGYEIKLPHLKTFSDWDDGIRDDAKHVFFIEKFVLSSSPLCTPEDYTVMVIYGEMGNLGYFKPGDQAWNTIDRGVGGRFVDVIYYRDNFYAIKPIGKIFACDFSVHPAVVLQVTEMPYQKLNQFPIRLCGKFYLVESAAGTLLAVKRGGGTRFEDPNEYTYGTYAFDVFKVDLGSINTWTEVKDIGNTTLFLGSNSSFSIEADDSICKPNCIYFTDDSVGVYWHMQFGGGRDTGIYNIEDATFISHSWPITCSHLTPPLWIE